MSKYLSIITLNINGLHVPIKRYRVAEWIIKHDPHICCLKDTHLRTKDLHRLKVKGWKKYSKQMNTHTLTKPRVSILISDKIDFKTKAIKKDLEGHFITRKGRIHQEDINIVNIYAPKYLRKILEDFKKDITDTHLYKGILTPHYQKWIDLPHKIPIKILWHGTMS